ncbi:MAG: hypothetical protein ACTSVA_02735 [Candidatus Njordarchaeales archaeon]
MVNIRIKPGKRRGELYRIILNDRYMMIKWKSGKTYFVDIKTGDNVPPEFRQILLKADREMINNGKFLSP